MSAPRDYIALDVEPGGRTLPLARIGICEVVDAEPQEPWLVTFPSPFHRAPEAVATRALEQLSDLLSGQTLTFYNASYDVGAIRKLYRTAAIPVPNATSFCGMKLAQATRPKGQWCSTLTDWVVKLALFSEEEVAVRRSLHSMTRQQKWLLWDAADDAMALARLVETCREHTATPVVRPLRQAA